MNETENFGAHVHGHAYSSVVAGHHNFVIDARYGSVKLEVEKERPQPVRRALVSVLPRPSRAPVGRDAEAAALAADIAAEGLIQLCGPGGIGKSTLLRHLARTVPSGPDGTVFVSRAHHQAGDLAQEIFEACYETWGYAPSATDLRGFMTGIQVTVYVDDADLAADQLRRLADMVPDATFVLASREASLLGDGVVHDLRGLDQNAAARLMSEALGRPLRDTDQSAMTALWQASSGNPLLLVRAAGLARSVRPGPDGAELPPPGDVPHLLPSLLAQLDSPAMTVLVLLSTLRDAELATAHIRDLTGEPDSDGICARLADLGLAVRGEDGYRCAPGVVTALQNRNASGFPLEWLCQYFTSWASDPATDPARVARHSRVFERLAGMATETGRPDLAVALGRAASPTLARSLRFDSWGRILGRGWTAARRQGDRQAEAYFVREESFRSRVTGRHVIAAALAAHAVMLMNPAADSGDTAVQPDQFEAPPEPVPGTPPELSEDSAQVTEHMTGLDNDIFEPVTFDFPDPPYPEFHFDPDPTGQNPAADTRYGDSAATDTSTVTLGTTTPTASYAPAVAPSATAGPVVSLGGATTAAAASAGTGLLSLLLVIAIAVIVSTVVNRQSDSPKGDTPSGIVGTWKDSQGEALTVRKSGPGAYTVPTQCGGDIRLTGHDSQASGNGPAHDYSQYECGPIIGQIRYTMTASADGSNMTLVASKPAGAEYDCLSCGTFSYSRIS